MVQRITVLPGIVVRVENEYQSMRSMEIPRFGNIITLPEDLTELTFYGRGPEENYIDRNWGTTLGIYHSTVKRQYHPYIRPQETGNKTDVRWLTLTNLNGIGIRIEGLQPLSISALNYRPEDFDPGLTKKFQGVNNLYPRKEVTLSVDLFQRGLGGNDSWGHNHWMTIGSMVKTIITDILFSLKNNYLLYNILYHEKIDLLTYISNNYRLSGSGATIGRQRSHR